MGPQGLRGVRIEGMVHSNYNQEPTENPTKSTRTPTRTTETHLANLGTVLNVEKDGNPLIAQGRRGPREWPVKLGAWPIWCEPLASWTIMSAGDLIIVQEASGTHQLDQAPN